VAPDHHVAQISGEDALAYSRWLCARLLTCDDWKAAARAGTTGPTRLPLEPSLPRHVRSPFPRSRTDERSSSLFLQESAANRSQLSRVALLPRARRTFNIFLLPPFSVPLFCAHSERRLEKLRLVDYSAMSISQDLLTGPNFLRWEPPLDMNEKKHPTLTLVLGAGASRPYRLPTSSELRKILLGEENANEVLEELVPFRRLCEAVDSTEAYFHMGNDGRDAFIPDDYRNEKGARTKAPLAKFLLDGIFKPQGVDSRLVDSFRAEFFKSQRVSIDAFVSHFPLYESGARIGVAATILLCERDEALDCDWYQHLLESLLLRAPIDFGSLKVITFNYDRSFEYFFHRAMPAYFGGDLTAARTVVDLIEVTHVYGQLGALHPHEALPLVPFGGLSKQNITEAAASLRLARGTVAGAPIPVWHLIIPARRVVILGFGFWIENEYMLRLAERRDASGQAETHASCYNLPKAIMNDMSQTRGVNFGDRSSKILDYLESNDVLRF
jgi:hypothetical protein